MTALDNHAILSEEQIAAIVARVLAILRDEQRDKALRMREAELARLRAFEGMHDLPRSIPTNRERRGE